jgi:hypothetical protein
MAVYLTGWSEGIEPLRPLETPIKSGPTFGVTIWGLEDFSELGQKKASKNYITFREEDFYYRQTSRASWNAYIVEGFVFPNRIAGWINHESIPSITLRFMNFEVPSTVFRLKVIMIKNSPAFIGLLISRIKRSDGRGASEMPKSGFMLGGPSHQPIEIIDGVPTGQCLFAAYPRTSFFESANLSSIDYQEA